jgi:hypothetical protein
VTSQEPRGFFLSDFQLWGCSGIWILLEYGPCGRERGGYKGSFPEKMGVTCLRPREEVKRSLTLEKEAC